MKLSQISALVLTAHLASVAHAQEAPSADDVDYAEEEIVVVAGRQRGSVDGDIEPEKVMGAQEIRAYGASSLEDLLTQLAPMTGSARGQGGRPVILINGKRVTGFREVRSVPPEAISRVEILPEEVSLSYGYPADQKVINFVLRQRFNAVTGEIEVGAPTAGGTRDLELEASLIRIQGDTRLLLDAKMMQSSRLKESDRDVVRSRRGAPSSVTGNIYNGGDEIDPALSALVGETVNSAGVPVSAANGTPALGDFAAGANNPNVTDESAYRTLRPETRDLSLGATYTRPVGTQSQLTLSGSLEQSVSQSRQGLASSSVTLPTGNPFSPFGNDVSILTLSDVASPLIRQSENWSGRVAAALNGPLGAWKYSVTAAHEHSESETSTDRRLDLSAAQDRLDAQDPTFNPFVTGALNGPMLTDRSRSNTDLSSADFVLNGSPFDMPAGAVTTTFKGGVDHRDLNSRTEISGNSQSKQLDRTQVRGQLSVDVPIASARQDVLAFLGELSLNANVAAEDYSDFGQLVTWGGGLTWRPVSALQIITSYTSEEGAPSIQQLGDPTSLTPNVFVFDYARGETVEVTRLDGGNSDLSADRRHVFKLGSRLQPFENVELRLMADYVSTVVDGPIMSFPSATVEIEAAFPERFQRDGDGRLTMVDTRPINFERAVQREVRWGLDFSQPIKPTASEKAAQEARMAEMRKRAQQASDSGRPVPGMAAGAGNNRPPGAGGPGMRGPGGRMGQGRFMASIFHTWRLEDSLKIRDGVPELDMLNGSATGNNGGVAQHQIEAQLGASKSGIGGRLSVKWESGTDVRRDPNGALSPDDLHFSSLATVNLRLFADLGQQRSFVTQYPWFRGSRISIGVSNLFDSKMKVTSRDGIRPENYQPDLIDPVGRSAEISFRKLFF